MSPDAPTPPPRRPIWLGVLVLCALGATFMVGHYHWDSLVVGAAGFWLLLKQKLFGQSLWVLIKKLPWLALAGIKKFAIKLVAVVLGARLGARVGWISRALAALKVRAENLRHRITTQWSTLNWFEQAMIVLLSLQLVLLVGVVVVLSKSLQLLALRKGSESAAEQVVKRSFPQQLAQRLRGDGEGAPPEDQDTASPPPREPPESDDNQAS